MTFTDERRVCADCGQEFLFSAAEQEFYAQKGFSNPPRRCKSCRTLAKQAREGGGGGGGGMRTHSEGSSRPMYDVVCDQCGVTTQVPFKPTGGRPVYCRDCFRR